jgi:CheY-like chemotaxis protein
MSHDIRTPMNAILGMTAIAEMNIDNKERVKDALKKITLSGKHLLGLINSVLDMSKIESGKINLSEDEFSVIESADNLMSLFHADFERKKIKTAVDVSEITHENVIGDSQRLQQILINIMGNAVKFTPDGGSISLQIAEKHFDETGRSRYKFVFTDTGIGMSEEFCKRIFEPFSRAADSRTTQIEGTGLGMPIALNIAKMMGGDIKVSSKLGEGSQFTVTVYLKTNSVSEEDMKRLANLPVLVVDDEQAAAESACAVLESLDMKAEYVTSGAQAVERIGNAHKAGEDFALVILDLKMPDMNGIDATVKIRELMGRSIPVIILSAYDRSDVEEDAIKAGVDAFIEKPLFKSRLTRALKKVIGSSGKAAGQETEQRRYDGKRVLLAEDNALNTEVATELLSAIGLKIDTAENGREAVKRFKESESGYYDLIFMDIQMPEMNGYEAAAEIRRLEKEDAKSIPIIAMTADAFADDIQRAQQAGMNGHISKPIDIAKIREVLGEKFFGK